MRPYDAETCEQEWKLYWWDKSFYQSRVLYSHCIFSFAVHVTSILETAVNELFKCSVR